MTPERWQRIGALFERALGEPEPARQAFVRASSEPPDIQDEVVALLSSHEHNQGFLEPPSHLEPGALVGAYRIVRILGRGGMGVVYLADDTRLHRAVALKSLPPHLFSDERMRSRLRQEARAAAALSHPSIATVYALEEIDNQVFIASEYLEGPTLREELAGGAMPATRAIATALEIGRALVAAHDRGIVHRDLKPENIVRTLRHSHGQSSGQAAGGIKILDFGLAQFDLAAQDLASVTRLTDPGVMAGTPPYMAPEQLLGQPTSARTDQFAFGVLLYELITGRHPFGGDSLPTVIARVLASEPEPDPRIHADVWPVIARSVEKKPEDRFETTAELVNALALAHAPGTLGTHPLGTLGTVGTLGTRRSATRGWWETHQLIVALVYWLMAWPAWEVHKWTGRWGVLTFLATLATIIVGGNLRLHLWFTSRTYPSELPAQRAHVSHWIRAADIAFALILIATGLVIADAHTGWGALFVAVGLGATLAFLIIEPTTARAALDSRQQRN